MFNKHCLTNSNEINQLKLTNGELKEEILDLKVNNDKFKADLDGVSEKIKSHETHFYGIEQYLRINNLEIVGLLDSEDDNGVTVEETLIDIFNSLPEIEISSSDIDICHRMPSNRHHGKNIAVGKFVIRKSKYDILNTKKSARDFKYKNESVSINDHQSSCNRNLFALATQKKREYSFKYIWTREGHIFMWKEERTPLLKISDRLSIENW